jgi:hypothetical protein
MLTEVLVTGIPRCAMLSALGPGLRRNQMNTVREDFEGAMEEAAAIDGYEPLKGSILEGALRIADEVDRCIRAHMITAENEDWVNRDAHLDILSGHATMMRGIENLTDVPTDYEGTGDADDSEATG